MQELLAPYMHSFHRQAAVTKVTLPVVWLADCRKSALFCCHLDLAEE